MTYTPITPDPAAPFRFVSCDFCHYTTDLWWRHSDESDDDPGTPICRHCMNRIERGESV